MSTHRRTPSRRRRATLVRRWLLATTLVVGLVATGAVLWSDPEAMAQGRHWNPWASNRAHWKDRNKSLAIRAYPNPGPVSKKQLRAWLEQRGNGASTVTDQPTGTTPTSSAPATSTPSSSAPTTSTPSSSTPTTMAPSAPTSAPSASTSTAGSTSGVAAPSSDLPGWKLRLSEDFTKPAALGSFARTYPGWAGYDTWRDTSRDLGRPTAQQGLYNSGTTTSVANGILDEYIHTVGSTPQVVGLTPPINGSGTNAQTYGRYAVRFRADDIPGYKMAWLLWPDNDDWTEGEIDFPEGGLGKQIDGFSHDTTGNPSSNAWSVSTGSSMNDWHTAVIEWEPGKLTFALDGRTWSTTKSSAIPKNPMAWVLQTETDLTSKAPPANAAGHVQIDWIAAWSKS